MKSLQELRSHIKKEDEASSSSSAEATKRTIEDKMLHVHSLNALLKGNIKGLKKLEHPKRTDVFTLLYTNNVNKTCNSSFLML